MSALRALFPKPQADRFDCLSCARVITKEDARTRDVMIGKERTRQKMSFVNGKVESGDKPELGVGVSKNRTELSNCRNYRNYRNRFIETEITEITAVVKSQLPHYAVMVTVLGY